MFWPMLPELSSSIAGGDPNYDPNVYVSLLNFPVTGIRLSHYSALVAVCWKDPSYWALFHIH